MNDTNKTEEESRVNSDEMIQQDSNLNDEFVENFKTNSTFRNFFLFLFTFSIAILIGYIQISLFNESNKQDSKSVFKETSIPLPKDSHTWFVNKNFFNETFLQELGKLAKTSEFSTLNGEPANSLLSDVVDSAGEAVEIGHNDCDHPFMTINSNRTLCHIPQRIDVGNHFIATGGFNSAMESYEKMVSRILVLHARFNNLIKSFKIEEEITKNENFFKQAQQICKNNLKNYDSFITDLYHFDFILLIAGQEVPMHLDVPFFMSADRSNLPKWLLVMMKQSKLFDNYYIPDIKGVLWLSEHKYKQDIDNGGHLYLYPQYKTDVFSQTQKLNDEYIMLASTYNRAAMFDGGLIIHGVDRFKPNEIQLLNKTQQYRIKYDSSDEYWKLFDSNNNLINSYTDDDVQVSMVWRMHCFKDENEKNEFYSESKKKITIEEVAEVFKKDLKSKNKLPTKDIKYLDLWTIVIKEYLNYPLTSKSRKYLNLFSFNYCLLPNLMPDSVNEYLNPILKPFC